MAQIKGKILPICGCTQITLTRFNGCHTYTFSYPTCKAQFKLFVPLILGKNIIQLKCLHELCTLNLFYSHYSNEFVIRPLYVICKEQQYSANNVASACKKIGLGIRLLQTLTAESLYSEGFPRLTFYCAGDDSFASQSSASDLECDIAANCYPFYSNLTVEEALSDDP
ncbi:unnamed protein product, partial [Protopolystoma xenopodis]